MTLDDYASVGGGALRLKGAKVSKPKKKKKKDKAKDKPSTSRELVKVSSPSASDQDVVEKRKRKKDDGDEIEEEDREPVVQKTETQLRHEEMKRKRVSSSFHPSSPLGDLLDGGRTGVLTDFRLGYF